MSGGILERVSVVLEVIREAAGRPLTLSEVTRRSGIPRSTVHRILEQLVALGWLARHDGHYSLGSPLFELGIGAAQSDKLMTVAWPIAQELYKDTGHAAFVGTLRGDEIVILQQAGGRRAATLPFRVGSRIPASQASMGKVLLSMAAQEQTGRGAQSAAADPRLRHELLQARETGVAFNRDELVPGLSCIGAAIRLHGKAAGVAISICGPSSHLRHRSLCSAVQAAAAAVSRGIEAPGVTLINHESPLPVERHLPAPTRSRPHRLRGQLTTPAYV